MTKRIKVYDNGGESIDQYTIVIGMDCYGMSINPHSPNGFNQYIGTLSEDLSIASIDSFGELIRDHNQLPKGILIAIIQRLQNN